MAGNYHPSRKRLRIEVSEEEYTLDATSNHSFERKEDHSNCGSPELHDENSMDFSQVDADSCQSSNVVDASELNVSQLISTSSNESLTESQLTRCQLLPSDSSWLLTFAGTNPSEGHNTCTTHYQDQTEDLTILHQDLSEPEGHFILDGNEPIGFESENDGTACVAEMHSSDDTPKDTSQDLSTSQNSEAFEGTSEGNVGLDCETLKQFSTPTKEGHTRIDFSATGISPIRESDSSNDTDVSSASGVELSDSDNDSISSVSGWSESEHDSDNATPDVVADFDLNQSENSNVSAVVSVGGCEVDNPVAQACYLNSKRVHDYSELSINEAILEIMDLYLKNKQSKKSLNRCIKAVCKLLPPMHNLPTSSQKILSYIESLAPPVNASKHYYCKVCLYYHGTNNSGQCQVCEDVSEFSHFYYFDIASILRYYFESRNLAAIFDQASHNSHNANVLRDLRDGSVFRRLNVYRGKYDANVILNSDGVRIRKGSPKELWLLLCTFAELPLHLQKSYITVLGVWYDLQKPDMLTFLKPYAEQMRILDEEGVKWTHPLTKEIHTTRVRQPVCVCDAPARSKIQNLMGFNSRYGCPLCEIKTQRTPRVAGQKRIRVYYYRENLTLRTKERMLQQASHVVQAKTEHLKGVKGPSALSIIPSVDVSQCMVPEYMHSCLLGVMKQLLNIWTTKPGPWSIKDKIPEIDLLLRSCKHPSFVHRGQRQLKNLKYWKASDMYYFLLFESLPCLKEYLPEQYFQHLILFVKGIFTLLRSPVKRSDVTEADLLLKLFVNQFEVCYGNRELTSNVHSLCHYGLCVLRYGPLMCSGAFPFEDMNGLLAKTTHGTNYVDSEIVNNIRICQGIVVLRNIVESGGLGDSTNFQSFSQGECLGREMDIKLPPAELILLQDENPKVFSRGKIGYNVFTSMMYKKLQSENFFIKLTDNEGLSKYGTVKYFAKTSSDMFVVVQLFTVNHMLVFYHRRTIKCVDHLIPVTLSNKCLAIKVCDILHTAVKVGKVGNFIYERPNLYHHFM